MHASISWLVTVSLTASAVPCAVLARQLPASQGVETTAGGVWRDADSGVDIRLTADPTGVMTGRIAYLRDSLDANGQPARDTRNPDVALRQRPIRNLPMLTGMRPAGARAWDNGAIYDARSGKTYKASMRLTHPDTLLVRGYVQVGFLKLGRTATWVRVSYAGSAR